MRDDTEVSRLWDEWTQSVDRYDDQDDATIDDEQRTHDALIDYVEAHGYNYTEFDPRHPGTDRRDPTSRVVGDPDALARLSDVFEHGPPDVDVEGYARSLGLNPPDQRPGWTLVYRWGPENQDEGL